LDFSHFIVEENLSVTSFEVSGLREYTTYYWRVRSRNALGMSDWSEVWNFTTLLPVPSQVALLSPPDGSLVGTEPVAFLWHESQPGVERYWFEFAADSGFTNATVDSTGTDTTTVVIGLQNNMTYWWRVRAQNGTGWGPFSEVWSFSVPVTGMDDEQEIPTTFTLTQNYPNPFNPSTTIRYALPENAHVKLEVFNMLGQRVAVLVDGEQAAGFHSAVFDGAGLASGVYVYRLRTGNFAAMKKFVLVK
jgi:hypothetical protein